MPKVQNRELIRCVRLALAEEQEAHWVLFSSGTVVKLYPATVGDDVWGAAIERMRSHQLSFFEDFLVQKIPGVEGWWVEIKPSELYVYIHPSEINLQQDGQILDMGLTGKEKFLLDAKNAQPIYLHLLPAQPFVEEQAGGEGPYEE